MKLKQTKGKNLEKKDKTATEFDKKNPGSRVKTANNEKLKKKAKKSAVSAEVKPLVKAAKKEIVDALKPEKPAGATKETSVENIASREIIKKAVKAAKTQLEKEKEEATTKNLFDDELRLGLQVVAVKVPKTPPHTKKILLQHSLFGDDQPDVCFIIRDEKTKKDQVDETVMKFEEKLKAAGITNVKTILPLTKLKKDFGPNNMKLKLLSTYDVFLVESEIAEHTYTILGKHFIKKRKRPHQIDTSKTETMKISIDHAMRKVSFKVSSNSNFSVFEVGTIKMETSQIVDNIAAAIEQLKEKWPGGLINIMRLYLKPMRQSKVSIPIYYSKVDPNDVSVPVEVGVKQTRLDKINEALAKKSKKLRIDRKTKKVVKAPGQPSSQTKKKGKKDRKTKTEKSPAEPVVASEEKPKKEDGKAKKKEKTQVVKVEVESVDETKSKKKKRKTEAVEVKVEVKVESTTTEVDAKPKKADKKKKNLTVVDEEPPKKKKSKKN